MADNIKSEFPGIGSKSIGSNGTSEEWNGIVQHIQDTQTKNNGGVDIGDGAINQKNDSVVIGAGASDANHDGASIEGTERTAIGHDAEASGWRCVAVGARAITRTVSATALGYGTVALLPHSVGLGRGAYCNIQNATMIGSTSNQEVHFGNSHGMDWDDITGTSYGVRTNPENEEVTIQGRDGKDWKAVSTHTNIKGGNIAIKSGRGTGTGIGGEVRFKTAPLSGAVGNNLNAEIVAGKFDSAVGVDTRFFLLDITDGTMKRVQFGADDSAGVGFKTLKVTN